MIKKILTSLGVLLLLLIFPLLTMGSAKVELNLGDTMSLNASNVQAGSKYKWVVTRESEILETQSTPVFTYTFYQQGEYNVNLTVTNPIGDSKTTSIQVLSGDRYQRPDDPVFGSNIGLRVYYSTLPPMSDDGRIHLLGEKGRVAYNVELRDSNIIEHRIDKNIFIDSDGDGIANNDIDNSSDDSYLVGGKWMADYELGESPKIVAEIHIVDKKGKKATEQVEIVFDDMPRQTGEPVAVFEVNPPADPKDKLIYLYGEEDTVSFYSKRSEGNILQYRIDKNIFLDSNDDGNPSNDVDNLKDDSFKTGDIWEVKYQRTDQQIIAQLIAVGEDGKGSRVQRELRFVDGERPDPRLDPEKNPGIGGEIKTGIYIDADKEFAIKGGTVLFTIRGLSLTLDNYIFQWDLDGDGTNDKEIEADNTVQHIYEIADTYPVSVHIMDTEGHEKTVNLEFLIKDVLTTYADFDYEIYDNAVFFIDKSAASQNLADGTLEYNWSFGDTDEKGFQEQQDQIDEKEPRYVYKNLGDYHVNLTVTDSEGVISTKSQEIIIDQNLTGTIVDRISQETPRDTNWQDKLEQDRIDKGLDESVEDSEGEEMVETDEEVKDPEASKGEGSIIVKIIKVILYLILIIVVLAIFAIAGLLGMLKMEHPDLVFEELVDELKIKILGWMGIEDDLEHESIPVKESTEPNSVGGADLRHKEDDEVVKEAELNKSDGPVPEWMKPKDESAKPEPTPGDKPEPDSTHAGKEVVEGEIVEDEKPVEPTSVEKPTKPAEPSSEGEDGHPRNEEKGEAPKEPEQPTDAPKKDENLNKSDGPVPDWLKGTK